MKRKLLKTYPQGSSLYVVAHGTHRIRRSRPPSATFLGIRNPRKALEFALKVALVEIQNRIYHQLESGYVIYHPLSGTPERLVLYVGIGEPIQRTSELAVKIAAELDTEVEFEFNGVIVRVRADSNLHLVYRDWRRGMRRYHDDVVGPYPPAELTAQELANDERIRAEKEERQRQADVQYRAEQRAKREAVEARLVDAGPMEFSDEESWNEWSNVSSDPLHTGVFDYAERWARVMQVEMATGKQLEDIAEAASYDADLEGMSGASYGAAVSILVKCWLHGERLRRWHNAKYQLNGEGDKANEQDGVINPAVITIG